MTHILTIWAATPDAVTWQTDGRQVLTLKSVVNWMLRGTEQNGAIRALGSNTVDESDCLALLAAMRDAKPVPFWLGREDTVSRDVDTAADLERWRALDAGDYVDNRPQAGELP